MAPFLDKNGLSKNISVLSGNFQNGVSDSNYPLSLEEFASYIPVRLDERERALLNVLESTLNVSEYTDNVDVSMRRGSKARRILDGILEACNIATGLAVSGMQDLQHHHFVDADERQTSSSTTVKKSSSGKKKGSKKKKKSKGYESSNAKSFNEIGSGGSRSLAVRDTKENAKFFQEIFEIGRRNKVLNPSKMRGTYGKLMHILQDAQSATVARSLGFTLHKDLIMVKPFLESRAGKVGLSLLSDPRLVTATAYVTDRDPNTGLRYPRETIIKRIQEKEQMKKTLVREYLKAMQDEGIKPAARKGIAEDNSSLAEQDLLRAIESIGDAIAVVEQNVSPVRRTLKLLEDNFSPHNPEKPFSLQLSATSFSSPSYNRFGLSAFTSSSSGGSTLSHSHSTQYTFVWQSLKLWCEVQMNMHKLWVCADEDLLSTKSGYSLWNTGQGLNRVQSCPKVGQVMRSLLSKTQKTAGNAWVGLSVVHLGDRDVPNALVFIDKYTQIPRFLNPLVDFVDSIPDMCKRDEGFRMYVESQFQSERGLKMTVLSDYFKHGFDGSGDDGGSCIDGRLTSSWNWTSRISKKSYYHAFMLHGFQGFDGDFK